MLDRFRISMCHPRLIGMFFKDSLGKVLLYIFGLFLLYVGVCAMTTYGYDNFTYSDTEAINQVIYCGDESDIVFSKEENKIVGTPIKLSKGNLIINFLISENYSNTSGTVLRFKEADVDVLYGGYILKTIEYKDINVKSFSLIDVKNGDDTAVARFQDMINYIFDRVDFNYATINLIDIVFQFVSNLFFVLLCCLLTSFFKNPAIGLKIRMKICLYSTSIYFLLMICAVLFNASWMIGFAIFLPFIYTNIAFGHIVRVDRKRVGGEG